MNYKHILNEIKLINAWYDFREEFEIENIIEFLDDFCDIRVSSEKSFYNVYPRVDEFVDLYSEKLITGLSAYAIIEPSEVIKRLARLL
jgi:hypothetical protein